jgi:SAM-dependent methyltransferase
VRDTFLPAMNQKLLHRLFPASRISGFTEVDGNVLFYGLVNSCLAEGSVVLDFGAGRGVAGDDSLPWRRRLAATAVNRVTRIAVDVDPAVLQNPLADERFVMAMENGNVRIPVPDASVDMIICDWVVEHLPSPAAVFLEFRRVLKPNGMACIRTSNKWHYAYIVARLLGESRAAQTALRAAQPGRKPEDVFPKLYRANSKRALRASLLEAGLLEKAVFTSDSEPAYVGDSWIGGLIGFGLHRLALLGVLPRTVLIGFASKK